MSKSGKKRGGRPPTPEASYKVVAEDLRRRIESQEWELGKALPSIRSLAQHYKVGAFTVRLATDALKKEGHISVNSRRRLVVSTPERSSLHASKLILFLASKDLNGVVDGAIDGPILRGLMREAGRQAVPLLMLHGTELKDQVPPRLDQWPCQGIVLLGGLTRKGLAAYKQLNIPVVIADRPGRSRKLSTVSVANEEAARDATRRLIELGHKRIAFVRYVQMSVKDVDPDSRARQHGYLKALTEAGIPERDGHVYNSFPGDKPGSPNIVSIFESRPRYTAVIAVSPGRAMLVARAAQSRGLTLGRELSLICFQEKQRPREPSISGPRIDFEEMGRKALRVAAHPGKQIVHEKVIPEWTDGSTIGPAPKA